MVLKTVGRREFTHHGIISQGRPRELGKMPVLPVAVYSDGFQGPSCWPGLYMYLYP